MAKIWMLTYKMRFHLQECRNIFYYEEITGTPSASEWKDIADEIRADFSSALISYLVTEWEFYALDYRQVDVAGLPTFTVVPTSGTRTGSSTSDSTATQVAMLVSVKGNVATPNQARTFLCGWEASALTDSQWDASPLAAAETFIDLQSALNSAGTNDLQRVAAQWNSTHTQVVAYNNIAGSAAQASGVPATQRRRRIGVGI